MLASVKAMSTELEMLLDAGTRLVHLLEGLEARILETVPPEMLDAITSLGPTLPL